MSTPQVVPATNAQEGSVFDVLSSLMGTPEKLFEYLIKILVVFLLLSVLMLVIIQKQYTYFSL
jgi:hypothetical protein